MYQLMGSRKTAGRLAAEKRARQWAKNADWSYVILDYGYKLVKRTRPEALIYVKYRKRHPLTVTYGNCTVPVNQHGNKYVKNLNEATIKAMNILSGHKYGKEMKKNWDEYMLQVPDAYIVLPMPNPEIWKEDKKQRDIISQCLHRFNNYDERTAFIKKESDKFNSGFTNIVAHSECTVEVVSAECMNESEIYKVITKSGHTVYFATSYCDYLPEAGDKLNIRVFKDKANGWLLALSQEFLKKYD